jgi:uncharacterized membrane protein YpjA
VYLIWKTLVVIMSVFFKEKITLNLLCLVLASITMSVTITLYMPYYNPSINFLANYSFHRYSSNDDLRLPPYMPLIVGFQLAL